MRAKACGVACRGGFALPSTPVIFRPRGLKTAVRLLKSCPCWLTGMSDPMPFVNVHFTRGISACWLLTVCSCWQLLRASGSASHAWRCSPCKQRLDRDLDLRLRGLPGAALVKLHSEYFLLRDLHGCAHRAKKLAHSGHTFERPCAFWPKLLISSCSRESTTQHHTLAQFHTPPCQQAPGLHCKRVDQVQHLPQPPSAAQRSTVRATRSIASSLARPRAGRQGAQA